MTIVWEDEVTPLDAPHMNALEQIARKGQPNGYASLGADGLVPPAQLPALDLPAYQLRSEEGQPNGYASLDAGGKVPVAQLPPIPDLALYQLRSERNQASGYPGLDAASNLHVAGSLQADRQVRALFGGSDEVVLGLWAGNVGPAISFGGDTFLRRFAAGTLVASGDLRTPGYVVAKLGDDDNQVLIGDGISFGTGATFASLYRDALGGLNTNADFSSAKRLIATQGITAQAGSATQAHLGDVGVGKPGILLGNSDPVSLYRNGLGIIRTDGTLDANQLTINGVPVGAGASGPAGGVLSGAYPNPGFAVDMATQAELDAAVATSNAGLGTKVDKDSVVVAATRLVASKLLAADAQPAFRALGSGKLEWGQGGATAPDTDLFRAGSGLLRTTSAFSVQNQLEVTNVAHFYDNIETQFSVFVDLAGSGGRLYFGPVADTNLYRQSGGILRTDGTLDANQLTINGVPVGTGGGGALPADTVVAAATRIIANKLLAGDANAAWRVLGSGEMQWGAGGAGVLDTSLYRLAPNALRTNGDFSALGTSYFGWSGSQWTLQVGTNGVLTLGGDTNLYRFGAGSLKTDGHLTVANALHVDAAGGGNKILFGSAQDTNLYRAGAGALRTDGFFGAFGSIYMYGNANGLIYNPSAAPAGYAAYGVLRQGEGQWKWNVMDSGVVNWGPGGSTAPDTNLYRSAAIDLRTNADFSARPNEIGWVVMGGRGPGGVAGLQFGQALDTNLYRPAANMLKTDGAMTVMQGLNSALGTAGQIVISGDGHIYFGSDYGYYLYRDPGGFLQTNAPLEVMHPWGLKLSNTAAAIVIGGDTNLYRLSAGVLKTDGAFVGDTVLAKQAQASQVWIGNRGPAGEAGVAFGSASDTLLYRSSAGVLKTSGQFVVGTNLWVSGQTYLQVTGGAAGGSLQPYKIAIYDQANGNFLGYMPLYSA